jgi:adapter protein MecA 1/2
MKIEKISNSQIRCILTEEDLASRQLRLSELAYGSEKARALFRDMMEQAAVQCGFDAENYPLMIEAIPLGAGSIVLIVTKVDNPEELDTRFSNFAPSVQKNASPSQEPSSPLSQLLKSIRESSAQGNHSAAASAGSGRELPDQDSPVFTRLYSFDTMSDAVRAAHALAPAYKGESALYRDEKSGRLYLTLSLRRIEDLGPMRGVIAAFSEYGKVEKAGAARLQYLITHCTPVCSENALETLSRI